MRILITIGILILNTSLCFSQVSLQWANRFYGNITANDASHSIGIDNSGNIIVAGSVGNSGTGSDFITIKYLPSGSLVWSQSYNSTFNNSDMVYAMVTDNSGNIYVTGPSYNNNDPDYATVKYNSAGVQQWVKIYDNAGPGSSGDVSNSVAVDDSGNVYVTGISIGSASNDIATIKYSSTGVQQWVIRYNFSDDRGYFVKLDKQGGVYVAGRSMIGGRMGYVTVKYNAAGTQQWVRTYSPTGGNDNIITGAAVDAQGNIIVTGTAYPDVNKSDLVTIKYSPAGVQQWVNIFDGPAHWFDYASGVAVDGADNIYVTGSVIIIPFQLISGITIKYSSAGQQVWSRLYQRPGSAFDGFSAITVSNAAKVYVAGTANNSLANTDITTAGYDSSGNRLWDRFYDGSAGQFDDIPSSIAADSIGNVYVTGTTIMSPGNQDIITLKYTPFARHDIVCGPIFNLPPQIYQFQTYTVKARIYNNSTSTETNVPVKRFINGILDSTITRNLQSGQYDTITTLWSPAAAGSYELKFLTALPNDTNRSNDTVRTTVQVLPGLGQTQVFSQCRNGLNINIGSLIYVYDTIFVNVPAGSNVVDVKVTIDTLGHTWDSDLEISIMHLASIDSLIYHRGGSGDNFMHTALTDSALIPISQGTPPFTGSYRPESPLARYMGANPNGAWILRILDPQGGDTGNLRAWCIQIVYQLPTGLPITENIPGKYALYQNYPNPFNPVTRINYDLPAANYVSLIIYDIMGREIAVLVNEKQQAGRHGINWDASNYPSGVYFYKLEAGESFVHTKKMVLIK